MAPSLQASHACLADEYRHGLWVEPSLDAGRQPIRQQIYTARQNSTTQLPWRERRIAERESCVRYEYANSSCGPTFSIERLCRTLACRSTLLVGDSTTHSLFSALRFIPTVSRHWDGFVNKSACPPSDAPSPRETLEVCGGIDPRCPSGINISFWRNDHLQSMPGGAHFGSDPGSNCDGWSDTRFLASFGVLVLSRGAHLNEYGAQKPNSTFHAERAHALASLLRPRVQAGRLALVWIRAYWGEVNVTQQEESRDRPEPQPEPQLQSQPQLQAWLHAPTVPLEQIDHAASHHAPRRAPLLGSDAYGDASRASGPQVAPASLFSWDLIPMINQKTVEVLRRARLDAVFIDPTLALAQRHGCRNDYLHFKNTIFLASTWRMIQNGLASHERERRTMALPRTNASSAG